MSALGFALGLLIPSVVATGCSLDNTDAESDAPPSAAAEPSPNNDEAGESAFATSDAGAGKPSYKGNPLCRIFEGSACNPDDDAEHHRRSDVGRCQSNSGASEDGGGNEDTSDAGAAPQDIEGCRLAANGADVAPACAAAREDGLDGTTCSSGGDCAPGFDCVAGERGSVCRRYCCADSCVDQISQSGGATFCDVQVLVDVQRKAPVCMPLKRCKLMAAGNCAESETCAIVSEAGETGCVTIGPASAGASCEENHCEAGLTCLGQAGNRKCYQLCKVSDPYSCGGGQTCKTSTLFKEPEFGVCDP